MVWQENWDAIRVLAACGTQWRSVAMGGISGPERLVALGLDYSAVESVMRILAISDPADTFWRLQLLEGVVLSAFAEHARAERARDFHHR